MQRWRFAADSSALRTVVGLKVGRTIRLRSRPGCGLFGPYVDLPAGCCTARVVLSGPGTGSVEMDIAVDGGNRVLASRQFALPELAGGPLELTADLDDCARGCEVRLHCHDGANADITAVEIDLAARPAGALVPGRPVGFESRKTYADKIASGFFAKYLSGDAILEIGYRGTGTNIVPIVPQAIGVDTDYPGYDGVRLPFPDDSQDAVYSSHCLEHTPDYLAVLREWYRVLKRGGYLILVVPHQHLFERRRQPPSIWNMDHRRFYTPAGLLREVEEAFAPNTYRVRHLVDNDLGFDYALAPAEEGVGCYEIELVLQKLPKPRWDLEDGTSRNYCASEFDTVLPRTNYWWLETDFAHTDRNVVWGPYVPLAAGEWEARYFFEVFDNGAAALTSEIAFDVSQNAGRIAALAFNGGDGLRALREGVATLRFTNALEGAFFEFRLHTSGKPFRGRFRFYGVRLDRIWPNGSQ